MKVVYTTPKVFAGWSLPGLQANLPGGYEFKTAVYDPDDPVNAAFYAELADADAVMNIYVYLGKKELDAMKKCKVVSFCCTGYNEIDLDYATKKGITVASVEEYCSPETAENAIANMMALQRGSFIYNEAIHKDHNWDVTLVSKQERIEGQTIGIVGLGRIGRHVARIAGKGLGMRVIAYDPFLPEEVAKAAGAELVDFDTLLSESDVVSIHMNLTDENVHMFNKETFKKMKKCPILVNEGRGPMVSEADLAWALDEGLVKAAALDMLETEMPSPEYLANCPLVGRKNVILNPHSGAESKTAARLLQETCAKNAVCCIEGRHKEATIVRNGIGLD